MKNYIPALERKLLEINAELRASKEFVLETRGGVLVIASGRQRVADIARRAPVVTEHEFRRAMVYLEGILDGITISRSR